MEIVTYRNHNPNAIWEGNPEEIINNAFFGINLVLKFIDEIDQKIREDYVIALRKNLQEDIKDYQFNSKVFDIESMRTDLTILNDYSDIQELIIQLVCKHMKTPKDYQPGQGNFEISDMDHSKAFLLWRYYRAKSFVDTLGREEGIAFWKKIAIKLADFSLEESEERAPIPEIADGWEKYGRENNKTKSMDFTVVRFDENRVLVKFDWCSVQKSLEYLNDPELSYLCYCYTGDVADERTAKIRRRRRSQTLHLGEFCDEFFWNNEVYPDAKQPQLEFMRKLGKKDPKKIIEEYQGKV
ncbi:MAG: hypothetical protein GNW80_17250 [Asgard group archaeon]|nr:hypothetical protein [Asgard group archaeon]